MNQAQMSRLYITKSKAGHYTATVRNERGTAFIQDKLASLQEARRVGKEAQGRIDNPATIPHYVKEHPEFPVMPEAGELETRGFDDLSWHNDSCPCFERKLDGANAIRVWIEHPDINMRESTAALRFYVEVFNTDEGNYGEDVRYIGDDFTAVLAVVDKATRGAQ